MYKLDSPIPCLSPLLPTNYAAYLEVFLHMFRLFIKIINQYIYMYYESLCLFYLSFKVEL